MTTSDAPQPPSYDNVRPHPAPPTQPTGPGYPWQPWPQSHSCIICRAQPVVETTIRAHMGAVVFMRFHSARGPWCQTCGIAVVRQLTTKTLWQGWWSPFSLALFTPFTLLSNLVAYRKLTALDPPGPAAPGATPLPEGPPVLQRPQSYIALVPLIWAVVFITALISQA
ncbi:hypothetical protein C9F11_45360 (plasmid) [Streptomyces sp. YIM 121038]|uniref:hypothetical protein n=1 Tax=Streptomyces sp. YIM 121038 TaxID=2136401 RepID=UPI001110AF9D|nr:hypothetical protein [Streptomyces sp. YIM 121038]QCX82632.1 hypothetical protein C9F11_45360 [Streptomyces sp. YIM 121038]